MFALMMSIGEDKKRFKLPTFPEDSNARDWKIHRVEPIVRSLSQSMAIVLATERDFTLDQDEIIEISDLLNPVLIEDEDGSEAVSPTTAENVYERIISCGNATSREWFRVHIKGRQIKYREANSQLWGLVEVACDLNPEVRGFIQTTLQAYTPEELQNLKGNWLLSEIVKRFHRDTQASLSTKLTEFHSMTLNGKFRNAHSFLIALEQAGRELVVLGGIDSDKLLELLSCRLIAGIKHKYEALAHSIELKRTEPGGISWDTIKSLVRTIDIDANSHAKRTREPEKTRDVSDKFSPKRFKGKCTYCGIFGHKSDVCRSRLGTKTQTPEKAGSGIENSAMKASTFRRSPGNSKGANFVKTTPQRVRCYRCGGPHYQSECKVSVASVKHAKELSLPEGYFIPEDLQAEKVITPEKVAFMMLSDPSDGRLSTIEKTMAELIDEVKSKLVHVADDLEIIISWNLKLNNVKSKLGSINPSTTSQMQRKSFVETRVNMLESMLGKLQENIFDGLQCMLSDGSLSEEKQSATITKISETNATASLPPNFVTNQPYMGSNERLPFSKAGAVKHPIEHEEDVSEVSFEAISEVVAEEGVHMVPIEPRWISVHNYAGLIQQHSLDLEFSRKAKLETDRLRNKVTWKCIRSRIVSLTDEEIDTLSEILDPIHYNGISTLSRFQRLFCLPSLLSRSIYDGHGIIHGNYLTISDRILLMELGLPPIVVNRLKDNNDISRLRLKCEFTTLRIQCSHEDSLHLQDLPERTTETRIIDGICYKVLKQTRARLPQPSESDEVIVAGISYKIPKQARLLRCQLSEFDDESLPDLIDDGSDSDSDNEENSIDTSIPSLIDNKESEEDNLLARNHGGVGKYCFPASSARRIEEDSIIDSGCSQSRTYSQG
jgi:hypothetical protein